MRIALAQINSHLGHFESNARKIVDFARRAQENKCEIVLFPEAALFGYHPMDLLERRTVVDEQLKYLAQIGRQIPSGVAVVLGAFIKNPAQHGKPYFNAAVVLQKGKKPWSCAKELLPTYDVFNDARHIEPGDMRKNIFTFRGKKILITICEDIWAWPQRGGGRESFYEKNPLKKIRPGSVDLILNLSASPYFTDKTAKRLAVTRATAQYLRAPMAYVNMVGGQDELIFDGASFAIDKKGRLLASAAQFDEDLVTVDFDAEEGATREWERDTVSGMRRALVLGLRDFVQKTGQRAVHLGLSGGIDSAVVACLAVEALGAQNVKAFALPGPHSTSLSLKLAKKLAKNLGIEFLSIPIQPTYRTAVKSLEKTFGKMTFGLTHENVQARLRGLYLMAVSNLQKSLLLNTTNKSEMAAGYGTMYGDLIGGLSPIGDLLKRDVYALARHYNRELEVIPAMIIDRAPSAELAPGQKDEDTLPPYRLLDESVVSLVEKSQKARTKSDRFVLKALLTSEFKRWQFPPILKVREHSFGQGRRLPIAHAARV